MMEESLTSQDREKPENSAHVVHALLHFAMAIQHRKNVVILCVFVTLAVGALYYSTATRYYSARAELFILASGNDTQRTGLAGQGRDGKNLMTTFERLITRSNVVEKAIEGLRDEERVDLEEVPRSKWVMAIQKNLSAKTVFGTNNIEVEYLSRDPAAAVAVVNQIVEAYLDAMNEFHRERAAEIIYRTQQQLAEVSEDLERLHLELSQKKSACGDFVNMDPDSKTEHPIVETMRSLQNEKLVSINNRLVIQGKLDSLLETVARGGDLQPHIMAVEDSVGQEMLKAALGLNAQDKAKDSDLERRLMDDISELNARLPHLGENHPAIEMLRSKISAAQAELARPHGQIRGMQGIGRDELARSLIGLLTQRVEGHARHEEGLLRELDKVRKQAESINGDLIEIQTIEGNIEFDNELRDGYLGHLAALSGAEAGPIIRAEMVSDPVQATVPASPNLRRVAMLSLLAGLAMGLSIVYVLDTLDDRFRSVEELQAQVRVPVMAVVHELQRREAIGVAALQLVAEPDGPESEAFRTLRTSLALTHDQSRRIVVTSAEPGDGKTTVLANLAVAFAGSRKRTLLIDADMRRPGLSTMLGIRGRNGLSTAILAQESIEEIAELHVQSTAVPGLDVLASGPRPANPTELLGNQRFADLLVWAEGRYDCILIDSPPTLAASDAAVIGQLVDGVLMVVQPQKNERRMVLRAVETFGMLKIPLIGIVANRMGGLGGSSYYGYAVEYTADPEEDLDTIRFGDEVDCPPEPSQRDRRRSSGNGGIDLSQLGSPRRRDVA